MLEAITNVVNQKQDNLVSGSNIKTINGYSILGSGDITVRLTADSEMSNTSTNPVQNKVIKGYVDYNIKNAIGNIDFSTLATKKEIQNLTNEIVKNEEAIAEAVNRLNMRINALEAAQKG